ncbi:MAG: hypothetical protein RLZ69_47, partial [Actinomycetota bacterium]
GAVPYTVFTAAMIVGRFAVGPLTRKIRFATISAIGGFVGATAMALGVYFSATFASSDVDLAFTLQLCCYAISGLGAASMVPSFYSAGGEVRGLSTAQALSRMSLANALGSGIVLTIGADLAPADARSEFLGAYRLLVDSGAALSPVLLSLLTVAITLPGAMFAFAGVSLVGAWLGWRWLPKFNIK